MEICVSDDEALYLVDGNKNSYFFIAQLFGMTVQNWFILLYKDIHGRKRILLKWKIKHENIFQVQTN